MKGSENYKSDVLLEKPTQTISAVPFQTVTSEQIEVQQNIPESIDNIVQQTIDPPTLPLITAVQQQVPVIAQVQLYNIQAQQSSYPINPQSQTETVNEVLNQQQTSPALNGKDDSIEKVSKASTVLGKSQAKKRLMAFSMMKQKLQEQNNSVTDNQSPDIGEGNDGEFVPEHNVFQTVTKKKIVTNKKGKRVINEIFISLYYYISFCTQCKNFSLEKSLFPVFSIIFAFMHNSADIYVLYSLDVDGLLTKT